jgi:hypothetical protein
MEVLIGARRPGRKQHEEKTDHGNMGDLTDVRRPSRPQQRMYENRQWEWRGTTNARRTEKVMLLPKGID